MTPPGVGAHHHLLAASPNLFPRALLGRSAKLLK
jgi:hypothetical protein